VRSRAGADLSAAQRRGVPLRNTHAPGKPGREVADKSAFFSSLQSPQPQGHLLNAVKSLFSMVPIGVAFYLAKVVGHAYPARGYEQEQGGKPQKKSPPSG